MCVWERVCVREVTKKTAFSHQQLDRNLPEPAAGFYLARNKGPPPSALPEVGYSTNQHNILSDIIHIRTCLITCKIVNMATEFRYEGHSPYPSPGDSFNSPFFAFSPSRSSMVFSPSSTSTTCCSSPASVNRTAPDSPNEHVVLKIEEIHEDPQIKAPPIESVSPTQIAIKRNRGRPRKHPLPVLLETKSKSGRTKTGCMTCRRRKKKCDEGKPECQYRFYNSEVALTQ